MRQRLAQNELMLDVSDAVLHKIGEAGFDPVYGARPLKRSIQQLIENPLAQAVISGQFASGDSIVADLDDKGNIRFN